MKQYRQATFFSNFDVQPLLKEDKPMAAKRAPLTTDQTIELIKMWDEGKDVGTIADELGVTAFTVKAMAKEVNKLDKSKCKPRTARSKKDIAKAALAALEAE